MPKRKIVVLQDDEDWIQYLIEAFDDTQSTPQIARTVQEALPQIRQGNPDIIFANATLLTQPLIAALKTLQTSNAHFRVFCLGASSKALYPFDGSFGEIPPLPVFQKKLVQHLPLPNPIRLLVVDDEPEIGEVFREYFDHRTDPAFIVETARNGIEGEEKIKANPPNVLVLDIKMPRKDGRELYRELKQRDSLPPTIVFFDIVSADEVLEIRRYGNPAFIEKGSRSSSMPEMAALIKKIAYFG